MDLALFFGGNDERTIALFSVREDLEINSICVQDDFACLEGMWLDRPLWTFKQHQRGEQAHVGYAACRQSILRFADNGATILATLQEINTMCSGVQFRGAAEKEETRDMQFSCCVADLTGAPASNSTLVVPRNISTSVQYVSATLSAS
jgi:hypothetical protein